MKTYLIYLKYTSENVHYKLPMKTCMLDLTQRSSGNTSVMETGIIAH